jgi:CubicO group peptidase (beta-lactamase class C family)
MSTRVAGREILTGRCPTTCPGCGQPGHRCPHVQGWRHGLTAPRITTSLTLPRRSEAAIAEIKALCVIAWRAQRTLGALGQYARGICPVAVVVGRHGKVVYLEAQGYQDVGTGALIRLDILFRLASMTKPVTAVAAMVCTERGLFDLRTPVSEFVPGFAKAQVYKDGSSDAPETEAAREPVRVWHLLSQPSEVGRLALVVLDITVVFMTQLLPPELHRFRDPLVVLVNQSAMA